MYEKRDRCDDLLVGVIRGHGRHDKGKGEVRNVSSVRKAIHPYYLMRLGYVFEQWF